MKKYIITITTLLCGAMVFGQNEWLINGNNGLNENTNFVGTTNQVSLRFRTNNTFWMGLDGTTGWLGLNTTTPQMRFHVHNGGILSTGTIGTNPNIGLGTRLMWIPDQGAFRAGIVDDDQWDGANVGDFSVAFGSNNIVSGQFSAAFSSGSTVSGTSSISFGDGNTLSGGNTVGIGSNLEITADQGVAIGGRSSVHGLFGLTLGQFLQSNDTNSVVIGRGVDVANPLINNITSSLMVGFNSTVSTLFVGPPEGEEVIGSVGIGDITAPTERLDVRGTARLREVPLADSADVIIVGMQQDSIGDYVLHYANPADLGLECTWDKVNGDLDLAMGFTGACVEGNVGIGIEPSSNIRLEVTSDLSSMNACGIRVRTTAFSDTTFGVFSFIQGMEGAESARAFIGEARHSEAPFGGHFTALGAAAQLEQPPVGVYGRADYAGSETNSDNQPIGVYGLATTTLECQRAIGVYGGIQTPDCMGSPFGVAGYFAGPVVELQDPITVSDATLKTEVSDISGALDLLSQITPKSYHFVQNASYGNVFSADLSYGFIAQEFEEALPSLVKSVPAPIKVNEDGQMYSTGDDLLGIKYTGLIPILVAGVQEQQSQIEAQNAEIDNLQDILSGQNELILQMQEQMQMMQNQINGCCLGDIQPKNSGMGQDNSPSEKSFGQNELYQNTPNPFRSQTTISYTLEQGGKVLLNIFDKTGKPITTLVEAEQAADTYRYEWDATGLPAGLYHYALYVDGELLVKKAIKLAD